MESDDVNQTLRAAENAMRDYLALILSRVHGPEWMTKSGIPLQTISEWQKTRDRAMKENPAAEQRLLSYSNFSDLGPIFKANWPHFESTFGERDRFLFGLRELRPLRNDEAHARGFLLHEKHLVLGFAGRIRVLIAQARSKMDSLDEHFPRIESIRDSLGFTWVPRAGAPPKRRIHVGDQIEFTVTAIDPKNRPLEYCCRWHSGPAWSKSPTFATVVPPEAVHRSWVMAIGIRTPDTSRVVLWDECVEYQFSIIPAVA